MVSLLELLCSDVRLIIHQYVHRALYERVINQYNVSIRNYWNDDTDCFESDDDEDAIILNYRRLESVHIQCYIYRFKNVKTEYDLPDNYGYTGIWWPLPSEQCLVTHGKRR